MDVNIQLTHFVITLCIGCALGLIFDFYRTLHRIFQPRIFVTYFCDTLYLIAAIIFAFTCLVLSNLAAIRFYIYFGIIIGWIFYYKCFSNCVNLWMFKVVLVLLMILRKIRAIFYYVFIFPFVYIMNRQIFQYLKKNAKTEENDEK